MPNDAKPSSPAAVPAQPSGEDWRRIADRHNGETAAQPDAVERELGEELDNMASDFATHAGRFFYDERWLAHYYRQRLGAWTTKIRGGTQ